MSVPNTFASATSAIPLANLDADFAYYDAAFQIAGTAMEVNYTFRLEDLTDPTKKAEFVMSAITTGTTRLYTMPNASGTLATLANTSQTFLGSTTFAPTTNSGTVTIGATPQTGTLTFGRSTVTQTVDIAVGATTAVSTKTVNIGTTGVSGSTTNINFGSAVAGAITNITLNSGTANGVTYLNASKVLTSGTALTFDGTKLDVNGGANSEMRVTTSGSGYLQVGQFSNGAFIGTSSTDPTAGVLRFGTGGTEAMRLTSTGLGIGTSSPAYKLDVAAAVRVSVADSNAQLRLERTGSGAGYSWIGASSTELFQVLDSGFAQRLVLDSSGNLGLGVTPSAWQSTTKSIDISSGGALYAGSVNIGLIANGYYNAAGTATYKGSTFANAYIPNFANNGSHVWYNAPSGTAGAAITFTQAMTLDASGNLLVGTTATYGGPGRINVGFNQSTNFGITLRNTSATATGVLVSFENSSGGGNGSISQTNSTTVAYNTSSDRRLKTAITPAVDAGSDIDAIQVVSHGWVSNDDRVKYGVIAQDLVSVAPQAVRQGDDGVEITETWGVDYSKLVPMLVKEIQSLRARVAQLESK